MKYCSASLVFCLCLFSSLCTCAYCDDTSVLVFPGANSRETYFTMHNIKEAQAISQGKGCKIGILDHSFGMAVHPKLYAGGKNFVIDNDEFLTFIHTEYPSNILPTGLWGGLEDGREPDVNVLQYDYTVTRVEGWDKDKTNLPFFSVSSMSPVVGGVVALMKSLRPDLYPGDCQKIIRETSHPMNYRGEKPLMVLDALAAVKRAKVY